MFFCHLEILKENPHWGVNATPVAFSFPDSKFPMGKVELKNAHLMDAEKPLGGSAIGKLFLEGGGGGLFGRES